jgi:hypothetical protein
MNSHFASPLDRFFRRKKLDTDLDLRKISSALIEDQIGPDMSACGKVSRLRHMGPGGSRESLPKRKVRFADYSGLVECSGRIRSSCPLGPNM